MNSPSARYEEEARQWDASGRQFRPSPDPMRVMKIHCWTGSAGARRDGVSETLETYVTALRSELKRQDADWYDRLLSTKDACDRCGETYRLENVSVCTNCSATFTPCHFPQVDYAPNGNRQCPHCREGEIVG